MSRGDEKDVLRFLREQWPDVDREYFGRAVEWTAEPYALVYRRDGKVVGVLQGHFIGGLASVDELMVAEGARGRGLGSLLLGPVRGRGAEAALLADRPAGGQGHPGRGLLSQARLSSRVRPVRV